MSTELQTATGAAVADLLTLGLTADAPERNRLHIELTKGFDIARALPGEIA